MRREKTSVSQEDYLKAIWELVQEEQTPISARPVSYTHLDVYKRQDLMNNNLWRVKVGLAEMLKGGVIMDVTNAEQAKIAEQAGACAVMALERVPSDIRKDGGVARMAAPRIIREIMNTVSIPVMAKVRIGHFAEAQVRCV